MEALVWTLAILLFGALLLAAWLVRERYRLRAERDVARARLADEEQSRARFAALAGEVLESSNQRFLQLAKEALAGRETHALAEIDKRRTAMDELVQPIRAALERASKEIAEVGKGQTGLREQVLAMKSANDELRRETSKLGRALGKPNVRGRYGEIQLERVIELAGMRSYCDFSTQADVRDRDGKRYRPDAVVRLPNAHFVAIDAKTSIDGYLEAIDAPDERSREAALDRYAKSVRLQVEKLSQKDYWAHLGDSPELVVMFIPGDQLVDAALAREPKLIELAAERDIVIASPSTLIGLLRAIHVGWREKSLSDRANELFELGRELHLRAANVLGHAAKLGESLEHANHAYNRFVGSTQERLLPTLRKFEEGGARSQKKLPPLRPVSVDPRSLAELGEEAEGADLGEEPPRGPRAAAREEAS